MVLISKGETKFCSAVVKPYVADGLELEDKFIHQSNAAPTTADVHIPDSHLSAMNSCVEKGRSFDHFHATELNALMEGNVLTLVSAFQAAGQRIFGS